MYHAVQTTLNKNMQKSTTVDGLIRAKRSTFLLLILTGFAVYICFLMAMPFLPAVVWALALAVLFTPLQMWLETKIKYANLAAIIAVLTISSMVIVPALFVGQQLALQAVSGAQLIQTKVESGEWQHLLNTQPSLAPIIEKLEQQINLPDTVKSFTVWVSNSAGDVIKGSIYQLIGFVITIYLLFFFLRDRSLILQALHNLLPLSARQVTDLIKHVGDTIHATVYGVLAVAIVQGTLGGLIFWWLELPAPLLWGLMMSFLAIIPILGASIIWIPAAVYLALEGHWQQSITLVLWGMLVVGTVDNLLRPILVGSRLKLHTLLAFISVVGGILLFGSSGLILGPVMLAITLFLISIWASKVSINH